MRVVGMMRIKGEDIMEKKLASRCSECDMCFRDSEGEFRCQHVGGSLIENTDEKPCEAPKIDYPEIECPCDHIVDGEIYDCKSCPYVDDDELFEDGKLY